MPMSVQMQAVFDKMEGIDQYVRKHGLGIIPAGENTLARFNYKVMVRHEDGSTMFFEDAYAILWEETYLLVYAEHNGNHIFHVDDLTDTMGWSMYHRTEIPTLIGRTWESHMQPHNDRLEIRDKVRTNIDPKLVSND